MRCGVRVPASTVPFPPIPRALRMLLRALQRAEAPYWKVCFPGLTCGKCNHVLCSECRTSDIIVPFDKDKWFFWYGLPSVTLSKHELFQVCSSCGLSARAESRGAHPRWLLKCNDCSASVTMDWRKYVVNPRPSQPSAKMLDDLKMARIVQKAAAQGHTLERGGSDPQYAQRLKASHEHDTCKVALRPTLSLQQLQKSSLLDCHIVHDQGVAEHRPDPILVANPGSFLTRRNALRARTPRSASSGSLIAARPHPLRAETLPSKVPDEKKWVAMRELMDKHNAENVVDLLSNPK